MAEIRIVSCDSQTLLMSVMFRFSNQRNHNTSAARGPVQKKSTLSVTETGAVCDRGRRCCLPHREYGDEVRKFRRLSVT